MTEGELLALVAAFYLFDALVIVREGEVVLVGVVRDRFTLASPGPALAALLPTADVVRGDPLPLPATSRGVYVRHDRDDRAGSTAGTGEWELLPYESLGPLAASGLWVKTGDRPLARAGSPRAARRLRDLLDHVRTLEPPARLPALREAVAPATDVAALRRLWERQRRLVPALRASSALLFVVAFGGLSLGLAPVGEWSPAPVTILAVLFALHLGIVGLATAMLARAGEAGRPLALAAGALLLVPIESMRAPAWVSERLYRRFDPLALTAVALDATTFDRFARATMHRTGQALERAGDTDMADFWRLRAWAERRILDGLGRPLPATPAAPADPAARGYCPMCWTEYAAAAGDCADCGVALRPFD